jgi:CTP:molybdopterin cytidylyltransferase MocA
MKARSDTGVMGAMVLAGGRSARFGSTKAILEVEPGRTFARSIIENMRTAGACDIVVVVNKSNRDQILKTVPAWAEMCVNENPDAGMLSSVWCGIGHFQKKDTDFTGIMIAPVDYPLVASGTYRLLVEHHQKNPDCIVRPVYEARGGHPVIIPWMYVQKILELDPEQGLRGIFNDPEVKSMKVKVQDQAVLIDIDTREDYMKWIRPDSKNSQN